MARVMESNAMLAPLVLNRPLTNLVFVCAKMAGRAMDELVMVRKINENIYLIVDL